MDVCRSTAGKAVGAVDVPESVIDLLTSLRDYLQDKAEPPIYVSDRRFMKAINLLQVAAFADGREEVIGAKMHLRLFGTSVHLRPACRHGHGLCTVHVQLCANHAPHWGEALRCLIATDLGPGSPDRKSLCKQE